MKRGDLTNGLPPDEESGGGDNQPRPAGLDRATELKLIDAAILGDMQALSELFEHYRPDLHGLCCRRLNDFALAEDAVQDIFIRALKSFPNFDRNRPVWPWFVNVALKACIDIQRRRSFTHYSGDIAVFADAEGNGHTESPLDKVIASEERAELWKSLDVLPERQRRAFVLYEVDGLSCADIAAAEGISVAAVYRLLFRARKKIWSVHQSGPLPAIVFPFTWLSWKLQRIGERIRIVLGVYSDGFASACVQAVCLGTVVAMVVAASHPESLGRGDATRSDEAVLLATQSQLMQTASLPAALPHIGALAEAPVEPQQPVAGPAAFLVDDVINPNQNATPENTRLGSITASPNYESDHTILVVGYYASRYVLFVSHDGGGTWQPRPSRFLDGATMVLPPDFPKDGRIFTFGGSLGLHQSDDGGAIFRVVSPSIGQGLAISPSFGKENAILGGDSKILIGGKTVLEYDAGTGVTLPALPTIPPSRSGGTYPSIAFSPEYPSDAIVFVSDDSATYRCKESICDKLQFPTVGPLRFRFSPRFAQDGLAYAFTRWKLLVSNDEARTFEEVQFPLEIQYPLTSAGYIHDMAIAWNNSSNPAIFASVYESSPSRFPPGIYRSLDMGSSWNRTSVDIPGFGLANKLLVTPTGRLLATGLSSGIACSEDLGLTWAPRCTPEQ